MVLGAGEEILQIPDLFGQDFWLICRSDNED